MEIGIVKKVGCIHKKRANPYGLTLVTAPCTYEKKLIKAFWPTTVACVRCRRHRGLVPPGYNL
jgi:hypothetical protein